jgi:energy-coupling factor transporter ATP-binding protein EcfA2
MSGIRPSALALVSTVVLMLITALAAPAQADDVTVTIEGTVVGIRDDANQFVGGGIEVGTAFSATYTEGDDAQDLDDSPRLGEYRWNAQPYGFAPFQLGNLSLVSSNLAVGVANDLEQQPGRFIDGYVAGAEFNLPVGSVDRSASLFLALFDEDLTWLDSDAVPLALSDPAAFELNFGAFLPRTFGQPEDFAVYFEVTRITVERVMADPKALIQDLKQQVAAGVSGGAPLPADGQSLNAKLDAALAALDAGDTATARTKIQDFINQVRAQVRARIGAASQRACSRLVLRTGEADPSSPSIPPTARTIGVFPLPRPFRTGQAQVGPRSRRVPSAPRSSALQYRRSPRGVIRRAACHSGSSSFALRIGPRIMNATTARWRLHRPRRPSRRRSMNIAAQAYQAFDPRQPLAPNDPRYVDCSEARGVGDVAAGMVRRIRLASATGTADSTGSAVQFLCGQRGSGRSTELLRLKRELELAGYFACVLDAERHLDVDTLAPSELPLTIIDELDRQSSLLGVPQRHERELHRDALQRRDELTKERRELLAVVSRHAKPWVERLRKRHPAGLVVLIDALDRVGVRSPTSSSPLRAEELLLTVGPALQAIGCYLVFVLSSHAYWTIGSQLAQTFGESPLLLPAVPISDRGGTTRDARGLKLLRSILEARIPYAALASTDVFDDEDTLDDLCQRSGGSLEQLLHLTREAIAGAGGLPVSRRAVRQAVDRIRSVRVGTMFTQDLLNALRTIRSGGSIAEQPNPKDWYGSPLLLEYWDEGGPWFGVNPLLDDLIPAVAGTPLTPTRSVACLTKPWRMRALTVDNVRNLKGITLQFSVGSTDDRGQWVFLVGENGRGKSSVLRALTLALSDEGVGNALLGLLSYGAPSIRRGADVGRIEVNAETGVELRVIRRTAEQEQVVPRTGALELPFLVAYGARRGSAAVGQQVDLERLADEPVRAVATLFDESSPLVQAQAWLMSEAGAAAYEGKDSPRARFLQAVCVTLAGLFPGGAEQNHVEAIPGAGVWVTGPHVGERMPLGALSDGYLTTLGWTVDMIARWASEARRRKGEVTGDFARQMAGVVLVDDVDLHLHPKWQYTLVRDLRAAFPRMTFVVSTHNPLTLLGALPGEIHVLDRWEDGEVEARQIDIPPAADTDAVLTGEWFGLAVTLDPDTADKLARYQQEILKDRSSPESWRLRSELEQRLQQPWSRPWLASLVRAAAQPAHENGQAQANARRWIEERRKAAEATAAPPSPAE